MSDRAENLNDRVYVELVRTLFATVSPSVIMSVGFAGSAALIWMEGRSPLVAGLGLLGVLASVIRLIVALRWRREARSEDLDLTRATVLERRFAVTYFAFAVLLGLMGAAVLSHAPTSTHMLMVCLLVGYAAGVATGVGLRPRIAIPSMLAAVVPAVIAAPFQPDPFYWATSGMMAALLAGAIHSMIDRYRTKVRDTRHRITFSTLARSDHLTALPNRLALRERFENKVTLGGQESMMALHYIDLNGFKPINDRYGHPAGDELLRAVAGRLARILRTGDIAARLGGDEFAVVQFGLAHPEEAELLAQRICRAIGAPYGIGTNEIHVSASVGYVTAHGEDEDLDQLLSLADESLYAAKRSDRHVVGTDLTASRSSRMAA